jgi:hypothetical protein
VKKKKEKEKEKKIGFIVVEKKKVSKILKSTGNDGQRPNMRYKMF